ncbi:organic cation transporter protein-like [Ostrea edulis]|uniref:organic cation transporter protein-like n=1 Tax=Ostrea edulis TaxID=37623 RepID=UPI0024AFFE67|nr:organic cation transporter protein-like [Ostrea edulis]
MDVDGILRSLGKYGRYQNLQFAYNVFCLPMVTYPVVIYVFIGHIPDFICKVSTDHLTKHYNQPDRWENATLSPRQCDVIREINRSGLIIQESIPCSDGYEYFGPETVASEWNLVCGSEGLGSLSTTMAVVGGMLGATLFPALADKYGRILIIYTTFISLSGCFILASFVPWFTAFVILRFLTGVFSQGSGLVLGTLLLELFPAESRGFVISLGSITWGLCISSMALIAFLLRHVSWRYTMLAAGLVGVHSLGTRWILHESLRWLVANGRFEEAKEWIKRAAKWNKKDATEILAATALVNVEIQVLVEKATDVNGVEKGNDVNGVEKDNVVNGLQSDDKKPGTINKDSRGLEKLSILDIFRNRHILLTSILVWIIWFVNSITYYGLFLTSGSMSGNMYLNFFFNGIVEIPSVFLYMFTINRYGRKKTCIMFHAIAGVSLSISAILIFAGDTPVLNGFAVAMSFAGKFGISGSFTTIFLYTPEIYPTNLRALGLGLAATVAKFGGMVSPYAALLGSHISWGPGVVFGSLSVLVTILFIWLPETTGKELPDTLGDVDNFYVIKKNKK